MTHAPARHGLARHGKRAYAASAIVQSGDGLYRYALDMNYGNGGMLMPLMEEGFDTESAARRAAAENLLRRMFTPSPSEGAAAREEVRQLTRQLKGHVEQRGLFD